MTEIEKSELAKLMKLASYFITSEETLMDKLIKKNMMNMIYGGSSGLFNKFNETATKQLEMTTAVSVICKKCNHVMYNHILYGKTDWHYCKTCLKSKKNSECV